MRGAAGLVTTETLICRLPMATPTTNPLTMSLQTFRTIAFHIYSARSAAAGITFKQIVYAVIAAGRHSSLATNCCTTV